MRLIAIFVMLSVAIITLGGNNSVLDRLDHTLAKRGTYIDARRQHIDSLIQKYGEYPTAPELIDLGNTYSLFSNDSAIIYYQRATELTSDSTLLTEAKLRKAALLPLAGFFGAAIREYESIDTTKFSDELIILYHESGRRLYSYLKSAFDKYKSISHDYDTRALLHQRRLLDLLDHNSDEYLFNLGEYYFFTGDYNRASALLTEVIDRQTDANLNARAYYQLASIAHLQDDPQKQRHYLALSAIEDIQSATLEVRSLQELGSLLYTDGDIEHSYSYLTAALDNAVLCEASLRMIETARVLPIIGHANIQQLAKWQRLNHLIMGVLVALLIGLGISLYLRYRQMKRLNRAHQRLREANDNKNIYFGRYLQLCSIYMDKLDRFCKIVERKITVGKSDELLRMIRSGKFMEDQTEDFYRVLDETFLQMYPNFVERVNELLRPDEQIILDEGERLNTELRLLAVKRMGVDDATTVARMLNYSTNTIYAYRNRLKSKAIDRDHFEENIMKIMPR